MSWMVTIVNDHGLHSARPNAKQPIRRNRGQKTNGDSFRPRPSDRLSAAQTVRHYARRLGRSPESPSVADKLSVKEQPVPAIVEIRDTSSVRYLCYFYRTKSFEPRQQAILVSAMRAERLAKVHRTGCARLGNRSVQESSKRGPRA